MSIAKGFKRILVPLIIIVLVPLFMVLLHKYGKNEYRPLPFIGEKGLASNGDTIYYTVPTFSLTDQNGQKYGTDELKGNIYVIEFFFTRCNAICPRMTKNLLNVQEELKKMTDLRIVSITLDPRYDTVPVLAQYAAKHKADPKMWHFLTGPRETIYPLINGFLSPNPSPADSAGQIEHSPIIALVDKEGHLRGQYDGTKPQDITRLKEDIVYLKKSYERNL